MQFVKEELARIFNGCEVWIENSTRVTVRQHKAGGVIVNGYPMWQNFQTVPNIHYRFFFLAYCSFNSFT